MIPVVYARLYITHPNYILLIAKPYIAHTSSISPFHVI